MKKQILLSVAVLLGFTSFAQRFEKSTSSDACFKRHFTYSIEGGYVDNQPRVFIAGNKSDYLLNQNGAKELQGNTSNGVNLLPGKRAYYNISDDQQLLLTDFVIPAQGGNALYGYGTGIYYPDGASSNAYPFFATYDRKEMQVISIVYYNLAYPGLDIPKNAA